MIHTKTNKYKEAGKLSDWQPTERRLMGQPRKSEVIDTTAKHTTGGADGFLGNMPPKRSVIKSVEGKLVA